MFPGFNSFINYIFSANGIMWVNHAWRFVSIRFIRKDFGLSEALSFLGSFLALAGGISLLSMAQFLLNILRFLITLRLLRRKTLEIPDLRTFNVFGTISDKLYHLKNDLSDFVKMSSIHGVRNLSGSLKEKIVWSIIIFLATWSCVRYVQLAFVTFPLNEAKTEFDQKIYDISEVCIINTG